MRHGRRRSEKKTPAWLLGLILGTVLFAIVLFVLEVLGYGDDPAIGTLFLLPTSVSRTRRGLLQGAIAQRSGSGIGFPLQSTPSAGR
jgi:hypothetical protein